VFRAVDTEVNAKLAGVSMTLGKGRVTFLNEREVATATNNQVVGRAWEWWQLQAMGDGK
jgi:hypothetical protein